MFDKNLVLSILMQIDEALGKIVSRANRIRSADDFIGMRWIRFSWTRDWGIIRDQGEPGDGKRAG
jgi:hypothetical protein